jgi:putative membrane protein
MEMKELIRYTALSLALAGLLAMGAAAQNASKDTSADKTNKSAESKGNPGKLSASDQKFVTKAAQGGQAEVELGKLATEKASSDEVKKFGQRMVDDHGKAGEQLKQLADSKGVTLPSDLEPKAKAEKDKLSKLSGEQFDREYMTYMVKDHKKDVAEFRHESKAAKDGDVKSFASQTLPTLEDHLKQAQSIAPKEKKEARMEKKSKPAPGKGRGGK